MRTTSRGTTVLGLASILIFAAACAPPPAERTSSGYVDVGTGRVFYEVRGTGPAVVLIHGGFVDRRMWDDQVDALAARYRTVRYDLRGFGRSSMPDGPYHPVADLDRLIDHLGLAPAALVGLSMGGGVALDYGLAHPDKVRALVLAATVPAGMDVPDADRERIVSLFTIAARDGTTAAVNAWMSNPMLAGVREHPRIRERMRTLSTENARIFHAAFWPLADEEPPALTRLGEIDMPALVVVGTRDVPIVQRAAALMTVGIRGARKVEIAGADHMVNMTEPEEFTRRLLDFLGDIGG